MQAVKTLYSFSTPNHIYNSPIGGDKMLYIARDGVGNITAICDNQTTAKNLQALIDDNVDEVLSDGVAEDYVYTIVDKVGFQHIATSEAAVVEHITSTPDIEFKEDSQFYGLPKDEAKAAIQI